VYALSTPKEETPTAALKAARRGRKAGANRPVRHSGVSSANQSVRRKDASWQHMYFFWCLCDYCVLVFLCYWESIN